MPSHHRYIKTALRRIWGWFGERTKAKNRAQIAKNQWKCEQCGAAPLGPKERQIDHKSPCEVIGVWDGWDNYINRMFCSADGLMVLCLPCHKAKSKEENAARRASRK